MKPTTFKTATAGVQVNTFDNTSTQLIEYDMGEWDKLTPESILEIGRLEESALSKTLDRYMDKINQSSNPNLFKLVDRLKDSVEKEDLIGVADAVLNAKPSTIEKILGLFNKKSLETAKDKALEATRAITQGKTKTLTTVIKQLEIELKTEVLKLDKELRELQNIRAEYDSAISAYDLVVKNAYSRLEKFKQLPLVGNNENSNVKHSREDKLQMLESRIVALDGTLTRMPADIEVIRQLLQSGFSTIQEVSTTAESRFNSIKMTLLTLHTALMNRSVQRLADKGNSLDENLLAVRSKITSDVCLTSASMSGDNRIAQAQQIKQIVDDTSKLMDLVSEKRRQNEDKFSEAKKVLDESKQNLLQSFSK